MKNAIKFGVIIGIVSGIWMLIMHLSGVYQEHAAMPGSKGTSWMEFASLLIPFIGLYTGIKHYRDAYNGGHIEFFEGIFEGFKIMLVAGVIVAFFAVIYIQYTGNMLRTDYMGRIAAAGIVGILLNLAISLMLMNKQRNL